MRELELCHIYLMGLRGEKKKEKKTFCIGMAENFVHNLLVFDIFCKLYTCKPNHDNVKSKIKK